jgi:hypothetical protein
MATKYKMENGQRVLMTDAEEADLIVESSNIKNNEEKIEAPYINQRRNAYPEIGDQLDMLWHSIDQNPKLKSEYFEFYETIKAVKIKHPKNG